jgi:hypothetical protein
MNPLVKKCKMKMLYDLHRTGLPTGLGRSAFERVDGPSQSSSRMTSVLPEKGGERLAKVPLHAVARRSRRRIP